jgi:hypothetical protein
MRPHAGFADSVVQGIYSAMELVVAPLLVLASEVSKHPDVPSLPTWFYTDAPKVFAVVPARVGVYSLQVWRPVRWLRSLVLAEAPRRARTPRRPKQRRR